MLQKYMLKRLSRSGEDRDLMDSFLSLLSFFYKKVLEKRRTVLKAKLKSLPLPVISVGNLVAGGTGKTPMTRYLAFFLIEKGYKPAILSRGYGGSLEKKGGRVSDGKTIFYSAFSAGDEPYLLAKSCPVSLYVGKDRYKSALRAMEDGADILILDDAFQHMALKRDIDLLLLDAASPFANGRLLPRGPLREEISALKRAHALIYTRCEGVSFKPESFGLPFFTSFHRQVFFPEGERLSASGIKKNCLAFSGIVNPLSFTSGLERAGFNIKDSLIFPDHHSYTARDLKKIVLRAKALGAEALICTAKDAAKLPDKDLWPLPLYIVDVEIAFYREEDFKLWLSDLLSSLSS